MVDTLQQFSMGGVRQVIILMLGFWLVWPVLCGILGARRGRAAEGVMHGLMWGPVGVLIVLAGGRRYVCPTCGKKTLRKPLEARPMAMMAMPTDDSTDDSTDERPEGARLPAVGVRGRVCGEGAAEGATPASALHPVAAPGAEPNAPAFGRAPMTREEFAKVIEQACAGYSEEDAARLRAWVNAEP